jgi:hypothetical protein
MATKKTALQFGTMAILDVPKSRDGKHKIIITRILHELDELEPGAAIRVPLEVIGDIKANVRSALNRATRKAKRKVATAADDKFLYIWNVPVDRKLPTTLKF